MSAGISAGILLFRRSARGLEVLIAHPGGPYWATRDEGAWTLPKGLAESGEELVAVAIREFGEETGFELSTVAVSPERAPVSLGEITLKSGKVVHGWAVEGDLDPEQATSNEAEVEWPPHSGKRVTIPEIDRVTWCDPDEARRLLHPAQAMFVARLEEALAREVLA